MRRFIVKVGLFFAMVFTIALALPVLDGKKESTNEFMAAMIDKHQRIDEISAPKLILAGGSNLIFGVDSEKLEKALKIPVANLGLRAHLGLNFILNELRDVAKKGDVVLLSVEYFMDVKGDENLHRLASYYNSRALEYYEPKNRSTFRRFFAYRHMLYKKLVSEYMTQGAAAYTRNDFNKYGDGIKHLEMSSPGVLGSRYVIKANKEKEIKALNNFQKFATSKGIKVLFTYSPYASTEFIINERELKQLHIEFKEQMQIKMISELEDFTYREELFFDNVYHLTKEGRELHTAQLIHKLVHEIEQN
ncbi:hypothetical protein [Maribacter sp. 2307UL18-2]|uniref:hypothetical protein n=1 Tax=Maribacter sp. 2307UL18-2 TaxID=3386274 RepID=UPI0039BD32AD